jgi:hypothetical protein
VDSSNYFPCFQLSVPPPFPLFFPTSTMNNNNSSQSVPSFVPMFFPSFFSSSSLLYLPMSTRNNNNSSQSVLREIDDSELIPAQTGTNRRGKFSYNCSLCGCFLSFMKETAYSCNMCCTYFTLVVRGETPYLVMSKESSSAKYRLKNCVCSGCGSDLVYFIGKARYGAFRCKCKACGISGLCLPPKNPATNARLVGWNELKQHTKGNPISKFALYKLRDSTK